MNLVPIVVQVVIAAISLAILFYVIKGAVLSALREHARTSVTAVSLVTSNFHKADQTD